MMDGVDITDCDSVISAAMGLIAGGESLDADMAPLIEEISRYEGPEVLGGDDYAAAFLRSVYHRPVPGGTGSLPAAEAVKGFGMSRGDSPSIGATAQDYGTYVANTVVKRLTVDHANASDIASLGTADRS